MDRQYLFCPGHGAAYDVDTHGAVDLGKGRNRNGHGKYDSRVFIVCDCLLPMLPMTGLPQPSSLWHEGGCLLVEYSF